MKLRKLKLAFIGGGINSAIGMTHKIASTMDDKFEVVCGCFSKSKDINEQTAESWHIDRYYDNHIDMIKNEKKNIDAIVILTPTNTHTKIILDIINFNIPIICEKTLTSSLDDTQLIKKICDKQSSFLTTIYNYTGYPMVRELKSMLANNHIGKIFNVRLEMPQESFIKLGAGGKVQKPQLWRLSDDDIPTISLDLGTHLSNMCSFLISEKPIKVVSMQNSYGHYDVIDNVSCMIEYENNINCQMWFSKCSAGHRNGLKVEVYGEKGSLMWYQMNPEVLHYCNNEGQTILIDRASKDVKVSNLKRYERFKAGHPAGFIEAFANHYSDIYDAIIRYNEVGTGYMNEYVFDVNSSVDNLLLMEAIKESAKSNKWVEVY
ncbi:Gfo/Idh/MocA family oxidoreductase [Francisella sp. 19X1-34]|uniref:Gfo/Idh/MocA family protein n=1 Tax=Francisella sp. 19X1-34 TaxID=3087177 RepID=UPI002E32D0D0|nr:Gfo/Idh/MocA family oxidoreductase [Francisella sp. 19X1-34]MED7787567.1 Gfo/Idh/MocA family oxidoreductase [Francisella sp. 19X1-34]